MNDFKATRKVVIYWFLYFLLVIYVAYTGKLVYAVVMMALGMFMPLPKWK